MPAYNAERTIAGAINSILTQTYENWELIIVDDGSEDKTCELVKRFDDLRIRLFEESVHRGVAIGRNIGHQKARGEYCIAQDADDYSLPNRLEKVIATFERIRPDVIVHGIYVNAWNNQHQCIERHYSPPLLGKRNVLKNHINGVVAYKRGVWQKKPFREETKHAYDWMMHLDWTLSGFKYATLNEGLYEYVRYQGSASDRFEKSGQRAEAFKRIKEIVKNEYKTKI